MGKYDHRAIEKKWAEKWIEDKTFVPDLESAKNPYYALFMFPYPSAEGLHIGNFYAFTCIDVMAKYKKLRGFDVFEPVGWDAFGIHSENYALKIGETPGKMLERTIHNFKKQMQSAGLSCDWTREVDTTKPEYYKWTQWIFTKLFEKGLAYQKEAYLNWCPSCKTVLADEQIEDGQCERCKAVPEKRKMKQWFFKITDYADRLLDGLEDMDWSVITKSAQKNWIGKSEGAIVKFEIKISKLNGISNDQFPISNDKNQEQYIDIFTTRIDTIFGCTYCVVAPEHEILKQVQDDIENYAEVEKYLEETKKKTDVDRMEAKEKTGVEIKGLKVINPFNGEELPIFVADYVLGHYGTGAVMAVPAHDERDFEFAKKYDLPIIKSIDSVKTFIVAIKESLQDGFYNEVKKFANVIENNDLIKIYTEDVDNVFDLAEKYFIDGSWYIHSDGLIKKILFHSEKDNRRFDWNKNTEIKDAYEYGLNIGIKKEQLDWVGVYEATTDDGALIDSGDFTGLTSEEARGKMTQWLEENNLGSKKINYRLRDWCISRQRYWGPPLPVIYCEKCGTVAVPEKDLPVRLPELKEGWEPSGDGRGPLAKVKDFMKTTCPKCGGSAERESDVMDNFLDSAWYFFRYISSQNNEAIFDKELAKKWFPVDIYIGGNEHAVLHLMYTRFITMAIHDLGLIDFDNPFKKFRANGMILKDGKKMSKSKGNVINPEEYGEKVGYDALKTYILFLGPLSEDRSFSDSGIIGAKHWAERVYNLVDRIDKVNDDKKILTKLHKTIKNVGNDMDEQRYNTAIAKLMEMTNTFYSTEKISKESFEKFIIVIAIFLSALAEELWERLGHKSSIFEESWPEYDLKKIVDEEIELIIQVNGKMRDKIVVAADITEEEAKKIAMESEKVRNNISGKEIKKIIFVKGRLVNIVIQQ